MLVLVIKVIHKISTGVKFITYMAKLFILDFGFGILFLINKRAIYLAWDVLSKTKENTMVFSWVLLDIHTLYTSCLSYRGRAIEEETFHARSLDLKVV